MNSQFSYTGKILMTLGLTILGILAFSTLQAQASFFGTVSNELGDPVENVPILLGGDANMVTLTDALGQYNFPVDPTGFYTVTPVSGGIPNAGVTTLDVVLINNHISGINLLDSPYKLIAADATNNGVIDIQDTSDIRDVLLGVTLGFPNNTSWRFVDAAYEFPDPANPWLEPFPESIQVIDPGSGSTSLDFIAIKVGDVNNSAFPQLDIDVCEIACGFIQGTVYFDEDLDCSIDGGEATLQDWIVTATSPGYEVTTTTNQFGVYTLPTFPGDYTVTLTPPNDLWLSCESSQDLTVVESEISSADFLAQPVADCPAMQVDLGTPALRACFAATYYIDFCNQGTVPAEDVSIELTFDPFLEVTSSTIPWSSVDGNTYTFEFGDLDVNECGEFQVYLFVSCDGVLGQTYCSEATAFPDTPCSPPPAGWDGSDLTLEGNCDGDSVRFEIRNVGEPMSQSVPYFVVEDDMIMMSPGETIQLEKEDTKALSFSANGSTWRVEVEQSSDHPDTERLSATIEGCGENTSGSFSLGFVNQFPHYSAGRTTTKDCVEGIGSYDPNDKLAVPAGVGAPHYIERNVELEYTIRFQNTGTDTAFNVILLDTLTEHLDVLSIRPGASSHDYHFNILGGNVLEFAFPNIMLPDSNINEAASHGFVKFRIQQQQDLELGTLIENSAAIYFDFNEPVITNTFFHTIGEDFLGEVSFVWETTDQPADLKVYPNPANRSAVIYVEGLELTDGTCVLFDAFGREVSRRPIRSNEFTLDGSNLSAGLYFFKVLDGNQPVGSGRLSVK